MGSQSWSSFEWTDERIARLRLLWEGGHSQGDIAATLGCTRSAVGGKVMRLGLTRSADVAERNSQRARDASAKRLGSAANKARKLQAARDRAAREAEAPAGKAGRVRPMRRIAAAPVAVASPSGPMPIDDRRPGRCCWPLWGHVPVASLPAEERLVCHDPVGTRAGPHGQRIPDSYCPAHRALASGAGTASEREAA